MGMIGMAPTEFWNCSVIELNCAMNGFIEFHAAEEKQPMDKEGLQNLMELYPD